VWGVARPTQPSLLVGLLPGLERARLSTVLAAPGRRDRDGVFLLRAEFASPAQAQAFRDKLDALLAGAEALGGKTPLGATLSGLKRSAKMTLDGNTLVASAQL